MNSTLASAALAAALLAAAAAPAADLGAGDPGAGEERYRASCVTCHGRNGRGMASFPAIAGRDAEFVAARLRSYRAREKVGPNSALMFPQAAELSDEAIADLAAFIAQAFR